MQVLLSAGVSDGGGTSQTLGAQAYLGKWFWNKQLSVGGKTGTSNSHADAWFVGVTPKLVGGAWVGGEYRQIHFRTGALGQGSRTALPIFGLFMRKVLEDPALAPKYMEVFREPAGIDPASINASTEYAQRDSLDADTITFDPGDFDDFDDMDFGRDQHPDADPAAETPTSDAPANAAAPQNATPNANAGEGL